MPGYVLSQVQEKYEENEAMKIYANYQDAHVFAANSSGSWFSSRIRTRASTEKATAKSKGK